MNVRQLMEWLWAPPLFAPRATVLIRAMAGSVFLWEGILKFVYTNQGVGRFTKLGFPLPELYRKLRGRAGDRRRDPVDRRAPDACHRDPLRDRNGRGDALHQDRDLPRSFAAATTTVSAADRHLGGAARDPDRSTPN